MIKIGNLVEALISVIVCFAFAAWYEISYYPTLNFGSGTFATIESLLASLVGLLIAVAGIGVAAVRLGMLK
jgi:hypothetical protein